MGICCIVIMLEFRFRENHHRINVAVRAGLASCMAALNSEKEQIRAKTVRQLKPETLEK